MRRQAIGVAVLAIVAGVFGLALVVTGSGELDTAQGLSADLAGMSLEQLEAERLRAEIAELRRVSDEADSVFGRLLSNGALITALAAIAAGLLAWGQHLQQRRDEAERAAAARLARAVADLGEENESVRASAAVTLGSMFRERSASLRADVFDIVVANLKVEHTDEVAALLVNAFEKGIRVFRPPAEHTRKLPVRAANRLGRKLRVWVRRTHLWDPKTRSLPPIDLKDAHLARVDLSGLDLRNVSIKFADLHGADLTHCDLRKVLGFKAYLKEARLSRSNLHMAQFHSIRASGAQFHECRMASIKLRHADLAGADFCGASAQNAQFESADLRGAAFEGADVTSAGFRGCIFDTRARRSLVDARGWRAARFANEDFASLQEVNRRRDQARSSSTGAVT